MFWGASSRKPSDGQVGETPEKVHRTALPDKSSPKFFEYPVSLHEDPPEPIGVLPIVRAVSLVLVEANRFSNFIGFTIDLHAQVRACSILPLASCRRQPLIAVRAERE